MHHGGPPIKPQREVIARRRSAAASPARERAPASMNQRGIVELRGRRRSRPARADAPLHHVGAGRRHCRAGPVVPSRRVASGGPQTPARDGTHTRTAPRRRDRRRTRGASSRRPSLPDPGRSRGPPWRERPCAVDDMQRLRTIDLREGQPHGDHAAAAPSCRIALACTRQRLFGGVTPTPRTVRRGTALRSANSIRRHHTARPAGSSGRGRAAKQPPGGTRRLAPHRGAHQRTSKCSPRRASAMATLQPPSSSSRAPPLLPSTCWRPVTRWKGVRLGLVRVLRVRTSERNFRCRNAPFLRWLVFSIWPFRRRV